jgi:hypothetical protein
VSWLLLALLQDQPGNRHIRQFKDACERAALTGTWVRACVHACGVNTGRQHAMTQ